MTHASSLPKMAISVRQPWAWAILHAGKDIENRPRRTNIRGRVAIHASLFAGAKETRQAFDFMMLNVGVNIRPALGNIERGGIIGSVEIVDCVTASDSPWFFGEYGYILRDPQPCEFIPVKGALGFFDWRAR
ncbi:ASCH domain-containing protein [Asticcacaulis sp.]|uniref:ASCH domain-containing protein n=1 Tax=Asticcacaulis sp. TaxID=1872648 RepID=UPI003F7CC50D